MAGAAQQAMAGLYHPGAFKAIADNPEANLSSFDRYVKRFSKWAISFYPEYDEMAAEKRWSLLSTIAGEDMDDLIDHIGKVQTIRKAAVVANAQLNIVAVNALVPDGWDAGILKIRNAIIATTNHAMARFHLYREMPRDECTVEKWGIKVLEQARRIDWTGYDAETAALDSILFQMEDDIGRKKIFSEKIFKRGIS